MTSLFYLEYEEKVIELLKNEIVLNIDYGNRLITHYRYKSKGMTFEFDLVELDRAGEIKTIYEIKTSHAVSTNFNFIKNILILYKNITRADIYLVYIDENNTLKINSLSDLKLDRKKQKKLNPFASIKSFSEFYSTLKQVLKDENDDLQYFFRGHSKYIFKPIPSVFREDNIKYENRMYYEAIRKNPSEFTGHMSTFDQLVKMQHYELPTRLLDITTNPLIALYFACKENENDDGEVLIFPMVNELIKNYDSDAVCVLANLVKRPLDFVFTKDKGHLVYDIQQDKPNFKEQYLESKATREVFCVMPKLNNERIIRQQGAFFIFGMGSSKEKPAKFSDEPIKIRITAASKKAILKDLQIMGINEATIFPETDKIMKQIKTEMNRR